MQNLIVDIGNTNIKINVFDADEIVSSAVVRRLAAATIDYLTKQILGQYNIGYCFCMATGSVPPLLREFLRRHFRVVEFSADLTLPINICYRTPGTLGVDRIAAVAGASVLCPQRNVLVVDAGTAITFDVLTANNNYLGGNISPGIAMRLKALHAFTNKLPLVSLTNVKPTFIGTTTDEAIANGVINGVKYEIQGYIDAVEQRFDKVTTIFTGGDIIFFADLIKNRNFAEKNLTAIGMNKILMMNV